MWTLNAGRLATRWDIELVTAMLKEEDDLYSKLGLLEYGRTQSSPQCRMAEEQGRSGLMSR